MASLASRIGSLIPEGTTKNPLRAVTFRLLFATVGTRKVMLGTSTDKVTATIERLLFVRESLGEREIDGYLCYYRPQTGAVIVNAGAYHGYFALYLSRKIGARGRVLCFEPEPHNIRLLRKNIAANGATNITVFPKALWSSQATLPLITRGSGSTVGRAAGAVQTAPAVTLDNELERHGITRVDLLTMDIEGAELEAIHGCRRTIMANPGIQLAIASYHRRDGEQTWRQLEKILTSWGLHVRTEFPRHLTTYARHGNFEKN